MSILKEISANTWTEHFSDDTQQQALRALETGSVLLMPQLAFELQSNEYRFLSPTYTDGQAKNISFDIRSGNLRGAHCCAEETLQLSAMLARYAEQASTFVKKLLPSYASALQIARTSFRPVEIFGRKSASYRKDDTRLHVDAFPASPNQGRRILRVFCNVNRDGGDRVWRLGEPFETVAKKFLPRTRSPLWGSAKLLQRLKITKGVRTHYDHRMLQIHDQMKADMHYQATVAHTEVRFTPNSSWIVQTDHVSHAAMRGQHVLEQTFYLPVDAMSDPEQSPLRILERLLATTLT